MSEWSDELRDTLQKSVKNKITSDAELDNLLTVIAQSQNYADAYAYASRYGSHVVDALGELGVDEWLFGSACEVWEPSLKDMYDNVGTMCDTIQANKNTAARIGLKPQRAKYDFYSIKDMIQRVVENPLYLAEEIDRHSLELVDKNQKKNADFLMNSGINVTISRTYDGVGLRRFTKHAESCSWCLARTGTKSFKSTTEAGDSGIFARHRGCHCVIDYRTKYTHDILK